MTKTADWLKKNWLWILIVLVAGFLIYELIHTNKAKVFGEQKQIDSLYAVVQNLNKQDSLKQVLYQDSLLVRDSRIANLSAEKNNTTLRLAAVTAENELLAYKIEHTPRGQPVDSADCQALAKQVDAQALVIQNNEAVTDSLIGAYVSRISLSDSLNLNLSVEFNRTDSAYKVTKAALDVAAKDNTADVKIIKRQGVLTKITAGIAIILLSIVVSEHIK